MKKTFEIENRDGSLIIRAEKYEIIMHPGDTIKVDVTDKELDFYLKE
jgi:hypothetical protein